MLDLGKLVGVEAEVSIPVAPKRIAINSVSSSGLTGHIQLIGNAEDIVSHKKLSALEVAADAIMSGKTLTILGDTPEEMIPIAKSWLINQDTQRQEDAVKISVLKEMVARHEKTIASLEATIERREEDYANLKSSRNELQDAINNLARASEAVEKLSQ